MTVENRGSLTAEVFETAYSADGANAYSGESGTISSVSDNGNVDYLWQNGLPDSDNRHRHHLVVTNGGFHSASASGSEYQRSNFPAGWNGEVYEEIWYRRDISSPGRGRYLLNWRVVQVNVPQGHLPTGSVTWGRQVDGFDSHFGTLTYAAADCPDAPAQTPRVTIIQAPDNIDRNWRAFSTNIADADRYHFQFRQQGETDWIDTQIRERNAGGWLIAGLRADLPVEVRVRAGAYCEAADDTAWGDWSDARTLAPPANTPQSTLFYPDRWDRREFVNPAEQEMYRYQLERQSMVSALQAREQSQIEAAKKAAHDSLRTAIEGAINDLEGKEASPAEKASYAAGAAALVVLNKIESARSDLADQFGSDIQRWNLNDYLSEVIRPIHYDNPIHSPFSLLAAAFPNWNEAQAGLREITADFLATDAGASALGTGLSYLPSGIGIPRAGYHLLKRIGILGAGDLAMEHIDTARDLAVEAPDVLMSYVDYSNGLLEYIDEYPSASRSVLARGSSIFEERKRLYGKAT